MKEIYSEVSKELGIPYKDVKQAYEHAVRWTKLKMKLKEPLYILVTGLGVFTINYKAISRKIKNTSKRIDQNLPYNKDKYEQLVQLSRELHQFNINRKRKENKRELCTA